MKPLQIVLVFGFVSVLVTAAPDTIGDKVIKQETAKAECNVTHPVQEDQRIRLTKSIFKGELYSLENPSQWCNLFCVAQKIGIVDENANLQIYPTLETVITGDVTAAKYANLLLMDFFYITRSTKNIQDKCLKAYITYHKLQERVVTLNAATIMEGSNNVAQLAVDAAKSKKELPNELKVSADKFIALIEKIWDKSS